MGLDGMGWDWLSLNRLAIRSPQSGANKKYKYWSSTPHTDMASDQVDHQAHCYNQLTKEKH